MQSKAHDCTTGIRRNRVEYVIPIARSTVIPLRRVRRPTSPCPPPLRTNHVGFPSIRSSFLQLAKLTHLVQLLMAGFMQMYQILCSICVTIFHCQFVMSLQFFSVKQVRAANRTSPVLAFSHVAQLSLVPIGFTISGSRAFQTRGWTFFVSEDQPPNDLVLRLRDSLSHKAGPRFEMLSSFLKLHTFLIPVPLKRAPNLTRREKIMKTSLESRNT